MSDELQKEHGSLPSLRDSHILLTAEERNAKEKLQNEAEEKKAHNAREERTIRAAEKANDLSRSNRNLTISVAVLTALTASATIYQGCVSRHSWDTAEQTLKQMQIDAQASSDTFQVQIKHYDATLGQTQLIASRAKTQAEQITKLAAQTERIAKQATLQAIASQTIASNASVQAESTQVLAQNSAGQLSTMQGQLEFTDRPWIALKEVVPAKNIATTLQWSNKVAFPFDFPTLHTVLYGYFDVLTENVGKSVAVDFSVHTELFLEAYPDMWGYEPTSLKTEQTRFCEAVARHESSHKSQSSAYFPNVSRRTSEDSAPAILQPSPYMAKDSVIPALIGCITYRFQNSDKLHETRFLYLFHPSGNDGLNLRVMESIAPEKLRLEHIVSLDFAN